MSRPRSLTGLDATDTARDDTSPTMTWHDLAPDDRAAMTTPARLGPPGIENIRTLGERPVDNQGAGRPVAGGARAPITVAPREAPLPTGPTRRPPGGCCPGGGASPSRREPRAGDKETRP